MSFELKILLTVLFVFVGTALAVRFLLKDVQRDFEDTDRLMKAADEQIQKLERPRG